MRDRPFLMTKSDAAKLRGMLASGARSDRDPAGRARPRKSDSARRAPFAGSLSKASKIARASIIPAVPVYIHAQQEELSADDRTYIRRKLGRHLGKFAGSIQRVSVRTEDVDGPRGGVDRVCRVKIVLSALASVVFEARDTSLGAAVDRALSGVERAVRRAVQRRRMKPLKGGLRLNQGR
jgi:putative sigma-54 modulation protein